MRPGTNRVMPICSSICYSRARTRSTPWPWPGASTPWAARSTPSPAANSPPYTVSCRATSSTICCSSSSPCCARRASTTPTSPWRPRWCFKKWRWCRTIPKRRWKRWASRMRGPITPRGARCSVTARRSKLPAPPDDDYYAAVLANHVLGSGNSSRLFQAVREQRGLVFGIQSRIETYSDTGLWLIQTACDPERADECRAAVESTVDQLLDAGVPDAELDLARRHLGAGLLMEDDDLEAIMERLAREAIYLARHPSLEEQIARLQRVTASQLLAALAARWDRRLYMSAAPAVDAEDDKRENKPANQQALCREIHHCRTSAVC